MDRRTLYISLNERRHIFLQQFQKSWLIVVFGMILFIAGIFVLLNNEVGSFSIKIKNLNLTKILSFMHFPRKNYRNKQHGKLYHWMKHF